MNYTISGIPVEITGEIAKSVTDAMAAYEGAGEPARIRVRIRVADKLTAEEISERYGVKNIIEEYGLCSRGCIMQSRYRGECYARILYDDDFCAADCVITDVEASGGAPLKSRISVAIGESVLNCLPAHGRVTFHASAIRYRGDAILFAAPSGTGKSTQAGLWKKVMGGEVEYINDDTPILSVQNGAVWAHGSPWAGTSGINSNISAPVKGIIYVRRSGEIAIKRVGWPDNVMNLLKSVRRQYFPAQRSRQNALIFEMAGVPVYELSCPVTEETVNTVKSALYE